jgi:hypothetical protein
MEPNQCQLGEVHNLQQTVYIFRSPAYKRNLELLILPERSLIKMLNKRGPRVDPCGSPDKYRRGRRKLS